MIVKLQAPLNHAQGPIMVYNKARSIMQTLPPGSLPEPIREALAEMPKQFWHAKYEMSGELTFGNAAPWQDW